MRRHFLIRFNKVLETGFTIKVNFKKSTTFQPFVGYCFNLKTKFFACAQKYTIDNKNANETDKTSKIFTLKQYKIIAA